MEQELRSLQVRIERLSEAGNAVIATIRIAGEGRSGGVEVDMHVHLVATAKHGARWAAPVASRCAASWAARSGGLSRRAGCAGFDPRVSSEG